jgi:hypothetical protein
MSAAARPPPRHMTVAGFLDGNPDASIGFAAPVCDCYRTSGVA